MHERYMNAIGVLILVGIMTVTPLVPYAVSAPPPQWVWDEEGRVSDATGQYRSMTDEEIFEAFGVWPKKAIEYRSVASSGSADGSGGGGNDGGGR
jgi:hypothetical protein